MARLGHARPVRPQIARGWIEFEAGDTNAPAGLAAATGDTPQATAHVQALAGVAAATGDASGATVQTSAGAVPRPLVATDAALETAQQRYRRPPVPTVDLGAPLAQPETQAPAGGPTAAGGIPVALEVASGDTATAPDHASFAVTDLDAEVTFTAPDWVPGADRILLGQNGFLADIGWSLQLQADGKLRLTWSPDGSLGASTNVTTTAATGLTAGTEHTIRVTLDVDNGAAGKTWTFFIDGVSFETASPAGTTSIFNSAQALTVGGPGTGLYGSYRSAKLRASIGGAEVANPDFGAQVPGTTSFADAAGRTWTLNNGARIHGTEVTVGAKAGVASAAGSAPQPTVDTGAAAPQPPRQPVVVTPVAHAVNVRRRQATAQFVDLGAPVVDVYVNPDVATATGVANQPATSIGVKPNAPTAAGTAPQPTVITGTLVNAGLAAGSGDAPQPEVTIAPQPPAAASAGTAPQPEAGVSPLAAAPTAAGTAPQPEATIGVKPNTAEAAGASSGTTVETGTFANAPAGLAAASGTANAASIRIHPNAGVGLAAGVAEQPEGSLGVKAGFGAGAGTAPQPTVAFGALAFAGLASGAGIANQPEADIKVLAGVSAATGTAGGVFALVGNPLGEPQGLIAIDDDHSLIARDGVGLIAVDDRHSLEV